MNTTEVEIKHGTNQVTKVDTIEREPIADDETMKQWYEDFRKWAKEKRNNKTESE